MDPLLQQFGDNKIEEDKFEEIDDQEADSNRIIALIDQFANEL